MKLLSRNALWMVLVVLATSAVSAEDGEKEKAKKKTYQILAEYVSPSDSLSRIRFLNDGQVSLNNQCPVRRVRLNVKMPAAYVNGRPVGFC